MTSGVDDDLTLKANHEAFQHYRLRVRRLVDGSKPDLRTDVFGQTWESPIFICPCGSQRAFHADGELATARAAKSKQTQMILSTQTSIPIEDVNKAYGKAVWFQLYTTSRWDATEKLVKRAEDSGSPVQIVHRGSASRAQHGDSSKNSPAGHTQLLVLPRRRRTRDLQPAGEADVRGDRHERDRLGGSGADLDRGGPAEEIHAHEDRLEENRLRAKMRCWLASMARTVSSCPITAGARRKAGTGDHRLPGRSRGRSRSDAGDARRRRAARHGCGHRLWRCAGWQVHWLTPPVGTVRVWASRC